MAGDIVVCGGLAWASNYSGYHRAMDFLIANVATDGLRDKLDELHENNIGILDLDRYPDAERIEILRLLRDELVPSLGPNLHSADMTHFRELADKAAVALANEP